MADIEEKLRKKREEEEAMWGEYIEQRKKQREKEEEELKKLKERQAKRKTQRAEQEKMLIEMKKRQEEQRIREIVSFKAVFRTETAFLSRILRYGCTCRVSLLPP